MGTMQRLLAYPADQPLVHVDHSFRVPQTTGQRMGKVGTVQHAEFYIVHRMGQMPYRKTVKFTLSATYEDGRLRMTEEDMTAVWEQLAELTKPTSRIFDNFDRRVIFDGPAYLENPSAAEPHKQFLKQVLEKHWATVWGPLFIFAR